jgi:hypothetical protein
VHVDVSPGGSLPDAEALHNGAEYNDYGHGFAIVAGNPLSATA